MTPTPDETATLTPCACGAPAEWHATVGRDTNVPLCGPCYRRELTAATVSAAAPVRETPAPGGPPVIDTAGMPYDPAARRLVTEASSHDLTRAGCPLTLPVRSHRTGAVVTFRRVEQVYTGPAHERELTATVYKHAPTGVTLHILND